MHSYLHPGVYIEEIPSGSRPIEGVATSTAAFVGQANRGLVKKPILIGNFDDYVNEFGPIVDEKDDMGLAVQAFYLNGGGSAYICRLAGEYETASNETTILGKATNNPVFTIKASSPGIWGNEIRFKIEKKHRDSRQFSLIVGNLVEGKFKELERFDTLSMNSKSDDYVETVVNRNSALIRVSVSEALTYQQAKVSGAEIKLANITTYLNDIKNSKSFKIGVNGSPVKSVTLSIPITDKTTLKNIATALQTAIRSAIGISEMQVSISGNAFVIETTGENNSSTSIRLVDSALLTALGLSSENVATITGTALTAAASPSVVKDDSFTVALDGYDMKKYGVTVKFSEAITNDGAAIAKEIKRQVQTAFEDIPSYSGFRCSFDTTSNQKVFILKSGGSDVPISTIQLTNATKINTLAKLGLDNATLTSGRTIQQGVDQVVPQAMTGAPGPGSGERLHDGVDTEATASDFTKFYGTTLRKYRDVSIIVLPGSTWDGDKGQANIEATLAHCESLQNRLLIIDPPYKKEFEDATMVSDLGLPTSKFCVLYYPWVSMTNPLYQSGKTPNKKKTVSVAPSALAAGTWAKIDGKRGVWKAPAGVEAQLRGASSLQYTVENLEQDQLNPLGINCIRKLPNYGSVFWGARTLAAKADPEWKYVPVRRTAIFIEESIYQGIQWAVFEPNDTPLWMSLRANIGSFMNSLFRAGAFQGDTAKKAYFVRCGLGDTMTQDDIDRGQVIVIVGFAPLKPAEFVIVRIQQKVGDE